MSPNIYQNINKLHKRINNIQKDNQSEIDKLDAKLASLEAKHDSK